MKQLLVNQTERAEICNRSRQDIGGTYYTAVVVSRDQHVTSLLASHLGLKIMGLAMGLVFGGHALGGALGAFLGGYRFDLFARYSELWLFAFGTAVLTGLMVFMLSDNVQSSQDEPTVETAR